MTLGVVTGASGDFGESFEQDERLGYLQPYGYGFRSLVKSGFE